MNSNYTQYKGTHGYSGRIANDYFREIDKIKLPERQFQYTPGPTSKFSTVRAA